MLASTGVSDRRKRQLDSTCMQPGYPSALVQSPRRRDRNVGDKANRNSSCTAFWVRHINRLSHQSRSPIRWARGAALTMNGFAECPVWLASPSTGAPHGCSLHMSMQVIQQERRAPSAPSLFAPAPALFLRAQSLGQARASTAKQGLAHV
jgi:hypothetical protein